MNPNQGPPQPAGYKQYFSQSPQQMTARQQTATPGFTVAGSGQAVNVTVAPEMEALKQALVAKQYGSQADRFADKRQDPRQGWGRVGLNALNTGIAGNLRNKEKEAQEEALRLADDNKQIEEMEKREVIFNMLKLSDPNMSDEDALTRAKFMARGGDMDAITGGKEKPKISDVNSLQTQIMKDGGGAAFQERTNSVREIIAYAEIGSAMSDMALMIKYMKYLDPTSTVKETEAANVENARGVPDTVRQAWNRMRTGERMGPEQRQEIVRVVHSTYPDIVKEFADSSKPFLTRANSYGIPIEELRIPAPYMLNKPAQENRAAGNPVSLQNLATEVTEEPEDTGIQFLGFEGG